MKIKNRYWGHAFFACTLIFSGSMAFADTFTGRVIDITDGDTLTLMVGRQLMTIKIAAIDAPERFQAWGNQSRTHLSRLTLNQTAVADCSKLDRVGHKICKLTVNTVDVGLAQISNGMAWWDKNDASGQSAADQTAYSSAELMAKLKRHGLWSAANPVSPWEFRRQNGFLD